jgi:hypothetical protein
MSDISTLKGCGTALVTPFKEDLSIDEPSLRSFVEFQVSGGIDFWCPAERLEKARHSPTPITGGLLRS